MRDDRQVTKDDQSTPTSTWKRIGSGLGAVLLFILSVEIMKSGASGLGPLIKDRLAISNAADSLGFSWLMAYLILSGSPVAAMALALLSADAILPIQAFTMITGSRLGASFVVLLIGLIYTLRGHDRRAALTTGILCFLLSGSIQLLTLPVGLLLMRLDLFEQARWTALGMLSHSVNTILEPLLDPITAIAPDWLLFIAGIGLITLSFRMFDKALPQLRLKGTGLGHIPRLVYRPVIMFLAGLAITVVTMSVSISIGILVPLSARGYIRRENLIPYILGANISTLVDTLVAGVLLEDPRAMSIVLVHMLGGILVSLPIILLLYQPYARAVSGALDWITRTRKHLGLFVGFIFIIPILLLLW